MKDKTKNMLTIEIYDSAGTTINPGDLLMIQNERRADTCLTFYTRLRIIDGQIYPFNKFGFAAIFKVYSVPSGCTHVKETPDFPEHWIHHRSERMLVDEGRLEKWRMDLYMFDRNSFFKVIES